MLTSEGEPAEEMVKTAQDEDVDLVAMGSGRSHDGSAWRIYKFFYWGATEKVFHEAPCSV